MKVTYDPDVDVLRMLFRNAPIEESDEDTPGIILDYDQEGHHRGLPRPVLPRRHQGESYLPQGTHYLAVAHKR